MTLRSITWILSCGLATGVGLGACDLPQKDLGDETAEGGNSDDGGTCEDGDTKLADDGCNTCECVDGKFACTEIACGEGSASGSGTTTSAGDDGLPPCEPGDEMVAPDGCNTCSCNQQSEWECTDLACEDDSGSDTGGEPPSGNPFESNEVTAMCVDATPFDDISVVAAAINGNDLNATLGYSGGCAEHLIGVCWDGEFAESEPVQVWLEIAHDDMNDPCDAVPTEDRTFDLTPLAEAFAAAYGGADAEITIHFGDWPQPLTYTF